MTSSLKYARCKDFAHTGTVDIRFCHKPVPSDIVCCTVVFCILHCTTTIAGRRLLLFAYKTVFSVCHGITTTTTIDDDDDDDDESISYVRPLLQL